MAKMEAELDEGMMNNEQDVLVPEL